MCSCVVSLREQSFDTYVTKARFEKLLFIRGVANVCCVCGCVTVCVGCPRPMSYSVFPRKEFLLPMLWRIADLGALALSNPAYQHANSDWSWRAH